MRVLVIGVNGQVARSLVERGPDNRVLVTTLGRPDLDLLDTASIAPAIARHEADVIINAAAYTMVDQAEMDVEAAFAVNASAPGAIALAAERMGVPLIHLSTDYVFDGAGDGWRREDDPVSPLGVYGRSKLAGEDAVRNATPRHVTLRTAWVFSPYGRNFVKTMLRLGSSNAAVRVVDDQIGSPTYALDLADGIFSICRHVVSEPEGGPEFGLFHLTGAGSASWAEFATAIFAQSARRGGPVARVVPIPSVEYPTPSKRPANSRLSNRRVEEIHKVALPDWKDGLQRCLASLIPNP